MGGWVSFYIVLAASIILSMVVTHVVYTLNERKFKKILQREEEVK